MTATLYTDEELVALCSMPKRVTNPNARWSEKPTRAPVHKQRSFKARGEASEESRFEIYQRQNVRDTEDFSCGIAYLPLGGSRLTLARYNGPGHVHGDISYRPHIHRAGATAVAAGRKPEREAKETTRYESLEGALACLIEDFNIAGLNASHDAPRLL